MTPEDPPTWSAWQLLAPHAAVVLNSLREIASRLVITQGAKRGRHPSPATVMRMLRDHDTSITELSAGAHDAKERP